MARGGAREAELTARWAAGAWCGETLATGDGEMYTVHYQGRRGGGAGPDFRDAVLLRADGHRVIGDIELHLRASGWRAHGHQRDPRYNGVVLHVALAATPHDAATPGAPLASGRFAPLVVLRPQVVASTALRSAPLWPCIGMSTRLDARALRGLLIEAGQARFTRRTARFRQALATAVYATSYPDSRWSPADRVLWVALAEALGYGRDREALQRVGKRLAAGEAPGALVAEAQYLPSVERLRLDGLLALHARWEQTGPLAPLRWALLVGTPRDAVAALSAALRVGGGAISGGRALIVIANVALPLAAAAEPLLATRAWEVYLALPGLPSNQITRLMARQLGLARLPAGAAAQQGLHHLWAEWCREKRCESCPCNNQGGGEPSAEGAEEGSGMEKGAE